MWKRTRRRQELLEHFNVTADEIPVAICNGVHVLKNPSIQRLADCLGLNANVDQTTIRDVIIVGARSLGTGGGGLCGFGGT